jgi:hypothetical protein
MINEDTNPKSIIVDGQTHKKFKVFCRGKSIKIGSITENLIQLYMKIPKEINKLIEENKD